MYNFNMPQTMQAMPPMPQTPKIFTMEVINSVEELNYKSAPTNGNPAFFMLASDNKIFQMRWNGRTNEITSFNVYPCVEFQQNSQQTQEKPTENDRFAAMEKTVNDLSIQVGNLIKALGANNEPSFNGNTTNSK